MKYEDVKVTMNSYKKPVFNSFERLNCQSSDPKKMSVKQLFASLEYGWRMLGKAFVQWTNNG